MSEKDGTFFDEARFLRRVRWRSAIRTALIALVVGIVSLSLVYAYTRQALISHENRISLFYPDLVRYSTPNTIAIPGPGYDVGWLGRQKECILACGRLPRLRRYRERVLPGMGWRVDIRTLSDHDTIEGRHPLYSSGSVPMLRFYSPFVEHQEKLPCQFDRLVGIPEDKVVEVALSFTRLLSSEEMGELLPPGVKPLWGAVAAYAGEETKNAELLTERQKPQAEQTGEGIGMEPGPHESDYWRAYSMAHRLVGIPFDGSMEGLPEVDEKRFPGELRRLAKIPNYSSSLLKRTADYLKKMGFVTTEW